MTRETAFAIVFVALLLLSLPFQGSAAEWYDLEDSYSTTNFDIYYTDNCNDYPDDCIGLGKVQRLGNILEEVRSGELQYGFDESDYDYRVFVHDIPAYGLAKGVVAIWDADAEEWVWFKMMDFDTYLVANWDDKDVRALVVHEFFHLIQHDYKRTTGWWDARGWITEGQANAVQDKIFTVNDEDDKWFYLNAKYYLHYLPSLMEASYSAALFWTYVTEQYGTIETEPGRGMDALLEFWEALETLGSPSNEFEVFNLMLSNLGHPELTIEDVFKDFVVANYAKDLTGPNVPAKYHYFDETQPPGTYGSVHLERRTDPIEGRVVAGNDFVGSWQPKYYLYQRGGQTSDVIEVIVNQMKPCLLACFYDEMFFDLLVVRNGDIVEEIRSTGSHFYKTLTGLDPADEIVLVVAGLDNSPIIPTKYIYSISPGGSLAVNILEPGWFRPAHVGPIDNPGKFLATVEVIDSGNPVRGLGADDFEVTVGYVDADVVNSAFVKGLYFLEVQAPIQQSLDEYGEHLGVTVAGQEGWVNYGVMYSAVGVTAPVTDTVIVLDMSGSMGYGDKLEAAKAAARLYVNSFLEEDLLALVEFDHDARLLHSLEDVSTGRSTILDQIDAIQTGGWTSIGDGLYIAHNELITNGEPDHPRHVVLLTDGIENRDLRIDDVYMDLYSDSIRTDVVLIGNDAQVELLGYVAQITGGKAFFAFDPMSGTLATDLANIYRSVAEGVRNEQRVLSRGDQRSGAWDISESILVDDVDEATVVFNYRTTDSLNNTVATLQFPDLGTMIPTLARERQSPDSLDYYGHFVWRIPNPDEGEYVLNIAGSGDIEYLLEASVRGLVTINMYFDMPDAGRIIGDEVPILVTLSDDAPILNADVVAYVTTGANYSDFQTWQLHLFDDGAHGDGLPNDGVYGNYFTRTGGLGIPANQTAVTYMVTVGAVADSKMVGEFSRETMGVFHLVRDPTDDRDRDALPDLWEKRHGLDSSSGDGDEGWDGDADQDGLKNFEELVHGTSPTNSDTDRGGESDYSEVQNERDPYYRNDDAIMPPLLFVVPGNQNATIFLGSWSAHESLSLYRSMNADRDYTLVASGIDPSSSKYVDDGLTNENTYYYKLAAVGATGEISGFTYPVSANPKSDAIRPWGTVIINGGDEYAPTASVTLDLGAESDVVEMRISNTPRFEDADWTSFADSVSWDLSGEGLQSVFVQFRDESGNVGGEPTCLPLSQPSNFAADGIMVDPDYVTPTPPDEGTDWLIFAIIGVIVVVAIVAVIIYFLKIRPKEERP